MFTIGDFARHGRVSVRMLRHYDAIGLLRPARVDPASGYRYYEAAQLARLNRIIALKELGFTLQQVGLVLDERVGPAELRGMLRLRQAELDAAVSAAAARLAQVEARLRMIESEGRMGTDDVVVKRIPPVRVAELAARAASYAPQDIGPVITPLYQELCRRLAVAGLAPTGPGIARYEDTTETDGPGPVVVHACFPVDAEPGTVGGDDGFTVTDLPAVESAATVVHRGAMSDVVPTAQVLARWIDDNGYRSEGYARELYLACPEDPAAWVTELQEPVTRA
ncbi:MULTISPECIES: MerR family transcriptional regulator [Streptomycetaceae]|uniref:Putative transcriptional regulator n=1 Tax=Streptantibioticus cattleyicolor (strain ATCC 35852 / DSM 46488 / JCM 4925 / NBRC 14057 / NRRL 8057) TaxID=1003195 RepID=F8JV94_STREN|nr:MULTISPECIES: MerR family transcriptional regulator [Streptomycetaceae]AEW93179.1 putative transcriptional regulator [Streptantibioticus cattleyicolor NRRL 8057 = DSM 46488]MYS57904.1 MerR family transcriptional regulator [Streptomyces sp. SID5468]CCB73540.1 putative transcriptional regulator [Streptantibioticus cattleyicolor NRRL 8057 = DSM 46488]